MTEIAKLLDTATVAALTNLDEPAKKVKGHHKRCTCKDCRPDLKRGTAQTSKGPIGYVVTKRSTTPVPQPRKLTAADAIEIDPESEALVEAECTDCHDPVWVDPRLPEGVDPETPRVPICKPCARIRAVEAAKDQRNVETIRRTQVAKHRPRVTDEIDHPVTTKKKEQDMDLSTMQDAELGALVKTQMRQEKAAKVKEGSKKAKKERKAEAKRFEAERAAAQAERKSHGVLAEFMVGTTLEIPALDLSAVSSLDECASAKERSPYNKARFRLTKEGPLDPEETTYRVLASEHERLRRAEADRVGSAKPAKKAKEKQALVAVMEPTEKAKVKAIVKTLGVDKKTAKQILAAMG